MKQTGTFHVYEIKSSQRVVSPIPNAFIYFVQNNSIKLTVKTDDKGKYNFDLPLGEYTVISSSEGGIEQLLANGSKFILTDQSTEKAFEEWVNAPSADVDEALLKRFKELAKIAEDAAREANEVLAQLEDNSIGEGEWTRKTYVDDEVNKKWDKEEGVTALAKKWDKEEGVTALAKKWDKEEGVTALAKKWDIQQTVGSEEVVRATYAGLKDSKVFLASAWTITQYNGFYTVGGEGSVAPPLSWGFGIAIKHSGNTHRSGRIHFNEDDSDVYIVRSWDDVSGSPAGRAYLIRTSQNTVVDSNGFLKAASPVLKLFNDRIETDDQFIEEPIFERIGEGTYKISNTIGLAQEGWTYEKPRGSDGNPYFRVLVKKTEDGCIISVHDEYDSIEEATITDIDGNTRKINKVVKVLSQARDIKPHERWIDLRFHEEPCEEIEPSEVAQ